MKTAIVGGRVLTPEGDLVETEVVVENNSIKSVGEGAGQCDKEVHTGGRLVLPGIIDIHGDAFERQIMPRPGVSFDMDVAFRDSDRQMLTNGITTAFHSVTYSWEPGLRGQENCVAIKDAIHRLQDHLSCQTRFHLRFETFNIDAVDEILQWMDAGEVDLIAYNDHTPEIVHKMDERPDKLERYAARTGLNGAAYRAMAEKVYERKDEVPEAIAALAQAASAHGIAQLSHDDTSPELRESYNDMGCRVAEFPMNEPTAIRARELGNHVVLGAPNVVRGGSHNGSVSAAEMVSKGLCSILASDYYYPAMLHAAFRLVRDDVASFDTAWRCISLHAAEAAGLDDRGLIAPGQRADIVIVDDADMTRPDIAATMVGGRMEFSGYLG